MEESQLLIESLQQLPYSGIFGVFLLANAILPLPEEVFIVSLGYIGGLGLTNLFIAVPLAISGLFISDIILFTLARSSNKYITRARKAVLGQLTERDLARIKTHITKIIFISRFLVSIRFIGPVLAGATKTSYRTFLLYNTVALLIYVPLLSWIGFFFHERISAVIEGVGVARHYLLFASVLVLFILFGQTLKRKLFKIIRLFTSDNTGDTLEYMDITIDMHQQSGDTDTFTVTCSDGTKTTTHTVSLLHDYYETLTGGAIEKSAFITEVMRYLLSRESPDAILPQFNVSDIPQYFSSFETDIKKRVQ